MERQHILHMFTPGPQVSPFDVNMAADAGFTLVVPYAHVGLDNLLVLTQDAIFSRGPNGVKRTGIFIGGRDVVLAADMLALAKKAMVPPFAVSVLADPSGSYTTAAAMIAAVERQLRLAHGTDFQDKQVLVIGGTGAVGRITGVLAARLGARVVLSSHADAARATRLSEELDARFQVKTRGVLIDGNAALHRELANADIVLASALAGVEVMSEADCDAAPRLLVAADVNAVPPAGIAGVGVQDDGAPLGSKGAVGIGALAIGNVKYQVEHRLMRQMIDAAKPLYLGFDEAFEMARTVVAEADAGA
jgi:methylene-tetrahydromethanopterin dehydrogenase